MAVASGLLFGTTQASADVYTVQSGDTLNKIAADNQTTVDKIATDNNVSDVNLIYVGEQFNINLASAQQEPVKQNELNSQPVVPASVPVSGGDVHAQFIAAGGSESMWNVIVLPESGGQPNVVSPNGYHGLGQTKESWGYGSVAEQAQGMVNYANSRYGSVENAVAFRASNNWW